MRRSNPFKQDLLRWLLEFCYPGDHPEGLGRFAVGSHFFDDPRTQELRDAVINVLRAYTTGTSASKKAVVILERAFNEPVELVRSVNSTNPPLFSTLFSLEPTFGKGARNVAEALHRYLGHGGTPFPFVCKTCEKVTELTKPNRRFCSEKCRNDFWNAKKMEGYYREKQRQSREHNKRLKKARKGGTK